MRNKKTPEQQDTEHRILGHVLAAFCEASDYEPDTKSLVMRIDYDEDLRQFRVVVYNDAFKSEELKPIEARGHFNEVEDVTAYRDALSDKISITRKSQDVEVDNIPTLYTVDELLDIYDEAVLTCAAQIEKGDRTHATLTKIVAAELRHHLTRQFKKGAEV